MQEKISNFRVRKCINLGKTWLTGLLVFVLFPHSSVAEEFSIDSLVAEEQRWVSDFSIPVQNFSEVIVRTQKSFERALSLRSPVHLVLKSESPLFIIDNTVVRGSKIIDGRATESTVHWSHKVKLDTSVKSFVLTDLDIKFSGEKAHLEVAQNQKGSTSLWMNHLNVEGKLELTGVNKLSSVSLSWTQGIDLSFLDFSASGDLGTQINIHHSDFSESKAPDAFKDPGTQLLFFNNRLATWHRSWSEAFANQSSFVLPFQKELKPVEDKRVVFHNIAPRKIGSENLLRQVLSNHVNSDELLARSAENIFFHGAGDQLSRWIDLYGGNQRSSFYDEVYEAMPQDLSEERKTRIEDYVRSIQWNSTEAVLFERFSFSSLVREQPPALFFGEMNYRDLRSQLLNAQDWKAILNGGVVAIGQGGFSLEVSPEFRGAQDKGQSLCYRFENIESVDELQAEAVDRMGNRLCLCALMESKIRNSFLESRLLKDLGGNGSAQYCEASAEELSKPVVKVGGEELTFIFRPEEDSCVCSVSSAKINLEFHLSEGVQSN